MKPTLRTAVHRFILNLLFFGRLLHVTQNNKHLWLSRILICRCVLVMLVFFFFFLHILAGSLEHQTNLLHREQSIVGEEGWGFEGNIFFSSSLSSPFMDQLMWTQRGRWMQRLYVRVCVSECVRLRTHVERAQPIRTAPGTSPPSCPLHGLLHLPPQWFLLQYKSQPALFSLTHTFTRVHTHTTRETDMHTHAYERKSSYDSPVARAD